MTDWDGSERRAAMLAAGQAHGTGRAVEIPSTILIVGFVVLALLQVGALWGHSVMSRTMENESVEARAARRQLSCFVVGITQGKQGSDLLTECGFIRIGGD